VTRLEARLAALKVHLAAGYATHCHGHGTPGREPGR
jgi:hypothetical protein